MEIEKQVVSREYAKRLKEIGVPQQSLFYHIRISDCPDGREDWSIKDQRFKDSKHNLEQYSAFTVGELGDMMKYHDLPYFNYGTGWQIKQLKQYYHRANTEADARALLRIWLHENNKAL